MPRWFLPLHGWCRTVAPWEARKAWPTFETKKPIVKCMKMMHTALVLGFLWKWSNPKSYGLKNHVHYALIFVDRAHFQTHPSSLMVGVHHFRQPVQVIHRSSRVGGLSQFTCDSHWAIQTSHNHKWDSPLHDCIRPMKIVGWSSPFTIMAN